MIAGGSDGCIGTSALLEEMMEIVDVECDELMRSEDIRTERMPQTRDADSMATVMVDARKDETRRLALIMWGSLSAYSLLAFREWNVQDCNLGTRNWE